MSKTTILIFLAFSSLNAFAADVSGTSCEMINPDQKLELTINNYVQNFAENNIFNQIVENALKSGESQLAIESVRAAETEALGNNNISTDLFQVMSAVEVKNSIKAIGEAKTDMEQYNAIKAATVNVMSTVFPEFAWAFRAASLVQDVNSGFILQKMNEDRLVTMKKIALIQKEMNEAELKKTIADKNAHCLYWNQIQINRALIEKFKLTFDGICGTSEVAVDIEKCMTIASNWFHFAKNQERLFDSIQQITFLTEMGKSLKAQYLTPEFLELKKARQQELKKLDEQFGVIKKAYVDHYVAESISFKVSDPQWCHSYSLNKSTEILNTINRYGLPKVCEDQMAKEDVLFSIRNVDEQASKRCAYSPLSKNQMLKTIELYLSKNKSCAPKEPEFIDK